MRGKGICALARTEEYQRATVVWEGGIYSILYTGGDLVWGKANQVHCRRQASLVQKVRA